ncbi:hypothetical protein CEXT_728791 [Caerostris extrusa]|uniref:Uncharacterized protein n=1 Tax=Caerostris extrusa TaxID=172846 RepID=A0AAV4W552_CAEEX|nr:hypothetical protein CEXT_728791 [Caerostris extrusa]
MTTAIAQPLSACLRSAPCSALLEVGITGVGPLSPCVTPAMSSRNSLTPAGEAELAGIANRKSPNRLSIPDLPAGVQLNRRRAANTTDQKTCVLLHSKLKGIKVDESS